MTQTESAKSNEKKDRTGPFESALPEGRQRFLAHVVEHGLDHDRRTPEDFIRHFPPAAIMQGLRDQPQLRANILVIATGVRSKIALKKPAESCGNDLQIALDEGETDAETIVTLFDPDDRVRYLDSKALWNYVTEGNFWQVDRKEKAAHEIAAAHVAFMIDRALKDRLITHKDVVDGITVSKLAELLPRAELEKVISAALAAGNGGKPYVESNLLAAAPSSMLVQHIPLPWIWDHVIQPRIAEKHGFVAPAPKGEADKSADKNAAKGADKDAAPAVVAMEIEGTVVPSDDGGMDMDVDDILGASETSKPSPKIPRPPKGS
ncbi:MAG: hypothetical protein K8H88_33065 [Sandaracinaceae bacterium]|nr:hypothetical protein [Sandaracinaceae bacterium]